MLAAGDDDKVSLGVWEASIYITSKLILMAGGRVRVGKKLNNLRKSWGLHI